MSTNFNAKSIVRFERDPAGLITLLQEWGVIARSVKCQKCGHEKHLNLTSSTIDGFVWACKNSEHKNSSKKRVGCYERISIRNNTFFAKSHLKITDILLFVRYWVTYTEINNIMGEVEISQSTATDWNSYCREVVINFCFTSSKPIGGPGKMVEIDKSTFGRRKYYRGNSVEGEWVFGGIERESGNFFLCTVEQIDAVTLIPLIQSWILPGTTVISDCWRSYNILNETDFQHLTVSHSVNFVEPQAGANTNTAVSRWRRAKFRMPRCHSVEDCFVGYLAKFMFLNRVRRQNLDPTIEFMRAAGKQYNPNNTLSALKTFEVVRKLPDSSSKQEHKSEEHKDQGYKCDKCLTVYKSEKILWLHNKHIHKTVSNKCTQCYKEFKSNAYLLRHIQNLHGEEQYECNFCIKMYKSSTLLRSHVTRFHRDDHNRFAASDNQQDNKSMSTPAVVSSIDEDAGNADRSSGIQIKQELEDTELDIEPNRLQHMDSHYRINQVNVEQIKVEYSPLTDYASDNQQDDRSMSTPAIVSSIDEDAGNADRSSGIQIKQELEDTDLDIEPNVFQHMDPHYRINQVKAEQVKVEYSPSTDEQIVKHEPDFVHKGNCS